MCVNLGGYQLFLKMGNGSEWYVHIKKGNTPHQNKRNPYILNGLYPSSVLLRQRFGIETSSCAFCDDTETTDHLFFLCMYSEARQLDVHEWLFPKIPENFSQKDNIYGLLMDNYKDDN